MRHIFVTKFSYGIRIVGPNINWSYLKAISAFITKNILNVLFCFFLMEGGPKICPTLDDFII